MSDKSDKKPRNFLRLADAFAVKEKLDAMLVKHDDGFCSYIGVDTDDTVAASFEFPCTAKNVAGVRKQFFGDMRRMGNNKTAELESRLAAVERDLADLRKLYANLTENTAANKCADAST